MSGVKTIASVALLLLGMLAQWSVAEAATCAIDPLAGHAGKKATSRFGVWRPYYNGGRGGGHQGQDLRAANGTKLYSPVDGFVVRTGASGSAGNILVIRRKDNNDLIWMFHLSGYAQGIVKDKEVHAGDFVALSGATGGRYAPHLHLEYTTLRQNEVRNRWITKGMQREAIFKAENKFAKKSTGHYVTDPAGFMCDAYEFVGGAAADNAVLGRDTKEQYRILHGATPNGGTPPAAGYTEPQEAAGNSVALVAQSQGKRVVDLLTDKDGYGALPGARFAEYEETSPSEMLATESKRRMMDAEWHKNLTMVSSRALWVDYLQTVAVGNYMQEAIYRKKERVEGLLATLTTQELAQRRRATDAARERAIRQASSKAVQ